jgi:hypothetical protein
LGPVFITDRGRPAHVLMSMALYRQLTGSRPGRRQLSWPRAGVLIVANHRPKIADLLSMPGMEDVEFEPPRFDDLAQSADLS